MKKWISGALVSSLFLSGCAPVLQAEGSQVVSSPAGVQRELHAMGTESIESLKDLKDEEFERAFLSQMITHCQGALDLANQILNVAHHPETREEAGKLISSRTREIAQMTGWLKDWYGAEPSNTHQVFMRHDLAPMLAVPIKDDRTFYRMIIHHRQGAIEMSRMVDGRSERSELRDLARDIRATEAAEIERYRHMIQDLGNTLGVDAR